MDSKLKISALYLLFFIASGMTESKAVLANNGDKDKYQHAVLDLELLADYYHLEINLPPEIEYNFYDANDNLVFTTFLAIDKAPGKELRKYLRKSDLLMDNGKSSYFRLNE